MQKILVIGYMHTKQDKRVYRTVKALAKRAEVIYQYLTDKKGTEYKEGNIQYIPIEWHENLEANAFAKLWKRRKLDEKIMDLIKNTDFDVLYMHHFMPSRPLEPFRYAKKKGKKVVYDVHEYHPENFLASLRGIAGKMKTAVMKKIFDKQIELSDRLIFVSQEQMDYSLGKKKKEVLIVPNYADMKVHIDEKRKEIVLVGKIPRRLDREKEIIKKLAEKGFVFKVIGIDSELFSDVEHIHTGFLPYEKMMEELSKAMLPLVSYRTIERDDYKNDILALPHKFYDSLAAGTPVIVKESFVSMKRIVEELGAGVVINPQDVDSAVKKILDAYQNYDEILEKVERHREKFVWNEEMERKFVEFVLR